MDWTVILVGVAVLAFFALIAWLRTDDSGDMPPPGEPGDADRFSKLDGS